MGVQEQIFDDPPLSNAWPALGWIVLAVVVAVTAFLIAPLP